MERAVNPQTGEVLFLVNNQWVPPAQTAKNDKGDTAYLVGNQWEIVPGSTPAGLPSIVKSEPREAPAYDPLGQVIGDVASPMDYTVEGKGKMNEPGAFTTLADLAKQFIAPGVKAPFALPQAAETGLKGFARQAMEGTPEAVMPSSVYQPGLDTEETLFGPETAEQKARRKLQAQRAVAAMPSIPGAAALNKIGENVQKDIQKSLSPEAKKALQESQITGNIFKGEVDFGTNPNAYGYALQAANVFGSMAPVIATAMVTKSPGVGGFVGGTMAADEAATSAAEFINKMPDAELRQKSPFYAELIAGGATPKEARELTIKKAAESGAALQGLVATFGDVLTGKLVTGAFDKAIAKLGTNRLARAAGVGTVSGLEEALQETGEGVSSDVALKNVIPSKEIGEDSAANLILGFLGGAGPGVAKGALSQGEQAEKASEREKYVKPEGGLAELIARQKGFLTPQGAPAAPPAAPTGIAPAAPVVPAAPPSESQDTEAMLREALGEVFNTVKSEPTPTLQKPEAEKPVETPKLEAAEEEAPSTESVKLYRGVPKGQEGRETVGGAFFMSPDRKVAEQYAGPDGNVTEEKRTFDNILRAPDWVSAKKQLGLPQSATMADLVNAAREAGHDGVTFNTTNGQEYIAINKAPKAPAKQTEAQLEPDEAFGITGGKAPQPQEFVEAKQAVDQVAKQVIKMRAKPAESLWSKLTGALHPEEVREIFGNNPNLGQRRLQVTQGGGRGSYIVDLVDNGTLDAFLPPDKRHNANNFDAAESAQLIKDAIGEKDYLPFDAKTEIEMMFDSVKFAEDLVNEYLTQEEQNRELQIAADEQREIDQNAEIPQPINKNRPAATGEREALELAGETPEGVRAKLAEQERRTKEEERAKKAAEDKAKADEQAAEFTLTGSDREADVAAARGQQDIFAAPKPQTEQERTVSMTKKEFREDKETRGKSDHPALKMAFEGMTPKSLIEKYGEKDVRFLGRLFDIDVKDKFNVAKKLIAIDKGLSLIRGKTKADFDKMNKEMLGGYLEAIGQSKFGKKYELVDRLLKHEGNVMGKFYDKLQDLKHKAAIINQARAGKPISEEVLKDYPDVAAYTLPRGSEGYKTAIRSLMMKSLPTLGMDIPAMVEAYRGDAKTTKDPVEKYVATDLADSMEQYHKTQFEKRNALNAKIEAAQEPTMTSMAAESRLIKEKLAAIDKDLTKSKKLEAMRGEKFVPDALDKKAIAIYKQIKENNPDAEVDEYIENPNTAHDIEEKPNAKDIRIGDLVYEKGDPVPKIAITVDKDSVKLIDQKTGAGVFSKIESVSKEPIPHDYSFDFGYGNIDVDVETFTSPTEWSVSMSGPGAGKTGYRSALGVKFEGKRGTPAFDEFVEKVVRNNTKEAAEAAPKDNKQEIADLRKEQKTLMREIIKAGLEETPEQEARMAEIDKRLRELEGKPAIQKEEKPAAKQRSVEEIQAELQDLEDQLDEEFNKDKRKALTSEIFKLQGELTTAEARAKRAAAEEPTEEPAEEPEAPKGTVATPDGAVLRYPLAVSLVDDGYKVLALDDPRTYKDKGGEPHRTFEKGPLRIAMTPQRVLFQNRNAVNIAFGNPDQVTLEAIMVDPGKRNQGLATQAMNDVIEAADKNEITLYLEPVPIINIKKNDFGLDRDQLVDFYSKFGFEFQEDSNKVMQRKPSAEVEVLPAEEPQAAGLIENEPYTFEGDFTEIAEEKQRLMLENQTENLSDAQVETLEKHYGVGIDTDEFFTKLREDVSNFIVKGATAVNGKIRAIIRQLANGLLSVAIAFNPQYMSQPLNVFMPEDIVRSEEVLATVPDAATAKMSEPGKRAFAVIYPAIQEQMQKKDKLFIVADKPSGRVFVFNPDGSLLLEKKSLFGLAKGDIYVGDNDKPQNRITPAGLFDLQLIDAKKGESEKRTAGDYDTGTVLAINDPDGRITIMHSVWLKENDAAQRAAALRNESAADSRYSFGCINVDAPTYKFLVNNHAKQMDGAALFIVPEVGTDVMSFITGKGAMSEDLARVKIKPVTKVTKTPKKQATPAAAQTKAPGKEEEIFMSLEPQTQTQAFKKWFGDSKVVDADGKPLVVYHGTIARPDTEVVKGMGDIMAFDRMFTTQFRAPSIDTVGSFFSTNPGEGGAQMYSGTGEGAAIYPVYLSIKNPYTTTFETMLRRARMMENGVDDGRKIGAKEVEALRKFLKETGRDGIHIKADPKGGEFGNQDVWIALEPEQIKSATGNRGTFDESGNINMSLEDDLGKLVNSTADKIDETEKKRSPSFKRKSKTLTRQRSEGKLTDEEYLDRMNEAIAEDEESQLKKEPKDRERGADWIVEKLRWAKRKGFVSTEGAELAEWFVNHNPALVDDLGISVKGTGPAGAGGFYNAMSRVITLIKEGGSDLTVTHEILHHLERMMPAKIQAAIRKAWLTQLMKANKAATDPAQRLYFMALLDAHIGNNNHNRLEIPKDLEKLYNDTVKAMEFSNALAGNGRAANSKSSALAKELLQYAPTVPVELYEYFDASEFWAVNGADIVRARYDAVKGGTLAKLKNWLREFAQKIKSMFGLKSDASIIRALDSLAKADGQFVTKDMLGTGDYQNIKKNAFGGEMPKATWAMEESSLFGDWIQKFQDNYRDLKVVQKIITDQIGKIDDRLNAYRKETLNPGREAERAGEFLKYEVEPLVKEMRDNNVSNQELATYLHNRYAEERNEIINAKNKNPAVQDKGSGISTENARKYLKELPADRKQVLESLAKRIDGIVRGSQDILVESGQETQEDINNWRKESPHYVPLKRDESELDFIVQTGSGNLGGFATAGKFGKEAMGSTKTVVNILENIMLQRDRAIRRAESMRIGQALYGLAIKYPNPDFWMAINPDAVKDMDALVAEMEAMGLEPEMIDNLLEQPKIATIKKSTGPEGETVRDVQYRVSRSYQNARNVFPVRMNGKNRFVLLNPKSKEAMRLAAELKQLDAEKLGVFFGAASTLSRWFAAVNTQYNPAFGLVNIINDTQGALVNLSTTPLAGQQMDVLRSVKPALFGIAKDIRKERKQTTKSVIKTEYDQKNIKPEDWTSLWRLFRQAGGKTGFRDQMVRQKMNVEWKGLVPSVSFEDEHAMLKAMEKLEQGPIRQKVEWWADAFSDFNDTLENTVRLAVFKVAYVDNKMSAEEAADIAKNITVNFNKRGAKTKMIRGLYAFFNASLQGTARYAITLAGPAGKTIVKTGLTMGAINALWMFMAGFDDDDPPQFTKNKGFIVPTGSGDYFIWNLPPGLRAIPNTGRLLTEGMLISIGAMKSNRGMGGKIMDAGSVMVDAINPFGGGTFLQTIAPTFLDPAFALAENKDSFGRPIFKEDQALKPKPGWQRTRDTASSFSKGLSWFLNYVSSGGEEFSKGFLSPTGDQLDYLIGQAAGGVGRESKRLVDLAVNMAEGEKTPAYRVPLANRFLGETKTEAATAARFYDNVKMLSEHQNIINGRIENSGDVAGYYRKNPMAIYAYAGDEFENDVNGLNKAIRDLQKQPDTKENRESIKQMKAARVQLMETLNGLVRRAQ